MVLLHPFYLEGEVEGGFSFFPSVPTVDEVWFGHDEDLWDNGGVFDLVAGAFGGIATSTAGGSGTAVSFIFTTTLSMLPSPFERVSLLNRLLNCDTDKEFVIVLEETEEMSEDVDEVIDRETVSRGAPDSIL